MQRAQDTERAVLERDFKQREERLRGSCTQQAERLRQEREEDIKTKLSQAQLSQTRGQHHTRHTRVVETSGGSATSSPLQASEMPTSGDALNKTEDHEPVGATTSEAVQQNIRSQQQVQEHGSEPDIFRPNATPPQPSTCVNNRSLARNRDIVELRRELVKHLAVAHEDSGWNLQEATRVMRLLNNLESRDLLESEVGSFSIRPTSQERKNDHVVNPVEKT